MEVFGLVRFLFSLSFNGWAQALGRAKVERLKGLLNRAVSTWECVYAFNTERSGGVGCPVFAAFMLQLLFVSLHSCRSWFISLIGLCFDWLFPSITLHDMSRGVQGCRDNHVFGF